MYRPPLPRGRILRAAAVFIAVLPVLWITAVNAQDHTAEHKIEVRNLATSISTLPAEYKADLTFQLLDSDAGTLTEKEKRALLEDVFDSASNARFPFPIVDAARHRMGLSQVVEIQLKLGGLDTLDIQTNVVRRLLPTAPRAALRLFEQITFTLDHEPACADARVANVDAYYKTLGMLLEDKRVLAGRDNMSSAAALLSVAPAMASPVQLAPMARLLTTASLNAGDFESATAGFVAAVSKMKATDREMTAIESDGQLSDAIAALGRKMTDAGLAEAGLLAAYRSFLVRSLSSGYCEDHTLDRQQLAKRFRSTFLQEKRAGNEGVKALSAEELKGEHPEGSAVDEQVIPVNTNLSPQLNRIADVYAANQSLWRRTGNVGATEPESSDVEDVLRFIVAPATGESDCAVCEFEGKETLFIALVSNLPRGRLLQRTIHQDIEYVLANSPIEDKDPSCWLKVIKNLINISRVASQDDNAKIREVMKTGLTPILIPNADGPAIKAALLQSNDRIISAYMQAESVLKPQYQLRHY
jgi:hypothetical protein